MWGKHKKLQDWVGAGLITETQAVTIQAFEDGRKKGKFGRGLVGLSVFAILVGILSIIAANWHEISGFTKISVHVLLNIAVAVGAYRAMQSGKNIWREGFTLAFFGLTLTLIVLIGQVFQLKGETHEALTLWLLATLPFMLIFSNGWITALPWTAAFLTTVGFVAPEYIENLPTVWTHVFYNGLVILLPLALFGDGSLAIMKRLKPAWAEVFLKTGAALLVIVTSLSTLTLIGGFRYYDSSIMDVLYQGRLMMLMPFAAGFAGILFHAMTHAYYKDDPRARAGALFAIVSLVVSSLPFVLMGWESPVMSALIFIAYWAFIGWIAQGLGYLRIVSLAIFIIAIRIFAIYCEVFGTLMDTGVGLIVGGIVMLGLLYGARKMNARLTRKVEVQV